jgi:sulfur carrier protein
MSDVIEGKMLTVNGVAEPLEPTVAALLAARDIAPDGRGVAVALNGAVVRRADWTTTALKAGDTVEIVRAMQGG